MKTPFSLSLALIFSFVSVASADLVGLYTFDNSAAPLTDDSGNGNTLESAAADPTYDDAGGVEGGAFEFDGTQRIVAPININPDAADELTVGAWVKTSTLTPGLYKVLGSDNGGWDRTIGLDNRSGDFRYTSFVGNRRPVIDTPGPTSEDDWTFFAVAYDNPNNEVTVYVDVDSSTTDDAPVAITEPTLFGPGFPTTSIGNIRPDNATEGWVGLIDNVFFFDEVLDSGQIRAIRDGKKTALTGPLAAFDPAIVVTAPNPVYGRLEVDPGEQSRTITVGNKGEANTLTLSSVTITGPQMAFYQVVSGPGSIGPGATGDFSVSFNPGKETGDFSATMVFASNDASQPEVTVDLSATVPARPASGTLLAFYSFDNPDTPLADSSGHGSNLELPGGAADPAYETAGGIQGGAYTYDGGDRLVAPININPDEVPELTVGAWVKTSSVEPGLRKVLGHDNGGWDRTIGLDNRSGDFRYTAFVGNRRPVIDLPGPESTDAWSFLAVTFDQPNNELTVFIDTDVNSVDDELITVTEPTDFGAGFPTFAIGGLRPDNGNEGWQGQIDNVFLAESILTKEQLDSFRSGGRSAIEQFGFGPPRANLLGLWTFDNAAAQLEDASGNMNALNDDAAPPTYEPGGGIEGGAFDFQGGQRLVADIDINPSEIPEMTWGAWVKPSSLTPGLKKIMGHDDGGWDRTIGLDDRSGDFRYTSFVGFQRPVIDLPGPENTDDWTFLAVVYNDSEGEVTVYVDIDAGTSGDTLVAVTEETQFGSGFPEFSIGNLRPDNSSEGWQGLIDNAFIYNTTLTATQLGFIRDGGSGAMLGGSGDDPDLVHSRDPVFGILDSLAPVTRTIPIQNGGRSNDLIIQPITLEGADSDFYSITAFPAKLAPGAQGLIEVQFDPKEQVGDFLAQLRIESNDESQPLSNISLGATTPAPVDGPILTGPTESPFGALPAGTVESVKMITIQNTGVGKDLVITSATPEGNQGVNFTVGDLPGPIAPGASAELMVTFNSANTIGTFRAVLEVVSNSTTGRSIDFDIETIVPLDPGNVESALIAFYSFDDPNNPLNDDSEKGNLLEIPDVEPVYRETDGYDGTGAYEFDGSNRFVAPIDINPTEYQELTIGAWVKPENLDPGLKKIIGHDNGGWDRTIGLDNRSGEFRYTSFVGNRRPVVDTPQPENTNDWTFIAVAYNQPAGEVTVYVDLDASTMDDTPVAVTEPTVFNPGQNTVSIGSLRPDNNNEGWVGLIDRAFFFSAALDAATIKNIRDGGVLPGGEDPNVRLRGGFGDLGKNPGVVTREITVQNSGREQTLVLTDARIAGPNAANYTLQGVLPPMLEPGETATLNISFDPQGSEGGFVAFLEVDSSDPKDSTETLDISALIPAANDLRAHYKLDETDGTQALDASGNGAHGTYTAVNGGAFMLNQDPLASGRAVAFDDAGDTGAGVAEVPAGAGISQLEDFSISLWVNQGVDQGVSVLFAKGEGLGDPFAVAVAGGSLVWFSAGTESLLAEGTIVPGQTTHVLTTYEVVEGEPVATFFVNGVEVATQAGVAPIDDSRDSIFQIGSLNGGFGFKGTIDDVQLYGQALGPADAKFLFENPGKLIGQAEGPPDPPVDPDRFSVSSVTRSESGNVELTWLAAQDVGYRVEYSTKLEPDSWSVIDDIQFTVNGNTATFEDTNAARISNEEGYYRIVRLP